MSHLRDKIPEARESQNMTPPKCPITGIPADDIVNLAFGLTLGAVAVAFALSFGLGGREAAGRQMEHWLSRMRGQK